MQLSADGEPLAVSLFCKDPESHGSDECETFYRTNRMSWMAQGRSHSADVASMLVSLAADETFCEISDRTVELFVRTYVKERYGIDLPAAAERVALER